MADHLNLFLFGDQTFDIRPHFSGLLEARDNLFLHAFLRAAYNALRNEIFTLSPEVRKDLPRFTCLEDLASWKDGGSGKQCIALDMAMTTIWQIGKFILQGEANYKTSGSSVVVGLCTGTFAAAAVSCSANTTELVPLAIEAVTASFKTGILVENVARRLTSSQDLDQSWAMLIESASSAQLVRDFNEKSSMPSISKPYISAYAPGAVTVSGPPTSLSKLVDSETFRKLVKKSIPIMGPFHAPHLYSTKDLTTIVSGITQGARLESSLFLSRSKTTQEPQNFASLLEEAAAEVLLRPILWNDLLDRFETVLRTTAPKSFSVVSFGSTAQHLFHNVVKKTNPDLLRPSLQPANGILNASPAISSGGKKPRLAIVGMSGRFPEAKNTDAFWDILQEGLDVHKTVPLQHWDARTHVDTSANPRKNTSATPFGCWLKDPEEFDARFFNISPKEAAQIDPAQRLALMTAYEAIERAGIVSDATPSTRPDRIGVFYGVTSNDWMETNSAQDIDAHMIPGGNRAFIPGRINYFFKFSGPSYAVDTACSSSLASIHLACNSLWCGDIDTAIAGGTNVITNPDFTAGLDRGYFLSRTGNCKTFDDGADGYCRGEGIATVIIKRLDDALADRDPILGVILGAYTNHSAESESITRPHVGAQRAIFKKILNETNVDPHSVSYIEMHGTGTQTGDAAEMSSVLDTFAPSHNGSDRARTSNEALFLGSAKANIGHGEAASGASGLIKVLMMMEKNVIVPHCGIKSKINHKFPTDLEERHVYIASKLTKWKRREGSARRALVNNFSAAGGNSAVLLEDPPRIPDNSNALVDSRQLYAVAVSAKTGTSMQSNLRLLLAHLEETPDISPGELSYTTTARRVHHPYRVLLVGSSIEEIAHKLNSAILGETGKTRPRGAPQLVFSFTGQGAQYPGMAQQLLRESSVFRNELHHLDQIATSLGFSSVIPFIESTEQDPLVFQPSVVQLASICVQMALVRLWGSWDIRPSAVVGHSLGEYAALNTAGVLSDVDTIFLVGMRAHLLEQKCTPGTHAMLVADGPLEQIAVALQDRAYEVACINSPTETVLAGPSEDMPELQESLKKAGMKSTLLKVPYAFHSSQVDAIISDFKAQAQGVQFSEPKIPVIQPLEFTASTTGTTFNSEYLARHSREPVNMMGSLIEAQNDGLITTRSLFVEIGPHPAISKMVQRTLGSSVVTVASLQRGARPWDVLTRSLKPLYEAGASVNWAAYQQDFRRFHKVIPLPSYAWDLKPYWIQYVNDWSLRKGDPPAEGVQIRPKIESTTIHSVVSESGDSMRTKIVVEADISREDLSPLVQGHEVDGIPLCTPSVYADMALTLGTYLLKRYKSDLGDMLVNVSDMTISKALILNEHANKQLVQVHAEADWPSRSVTTKFMSFNNHQKLQEHARCIVRYTDRGLQKKLQENAAEIQMKISELRNGVASGKTARYNRAMVYRAIRPLARFHNDYRAIDEIVLNSDTLEASSTLSFGSVKRDGDFHTHPAIIDSLTQACGFTMNCNDNTDLDVEVFMNHGWGSLQLFEPIDFEKVYTTYSRMESGPDKLWRGDAIILEGDRVVAHFGQIAIQGVPRRVLKVILSLESGRKPQGGNPITQRSIADSSEPRVGSARQDAVQEQVSHRTGPSPIDVGLQIIAEESGVAIDGFTDDAVFADMGVDSLLGLTISARFREQLDVELDFNGLFYEYPTVKDLKAYLHKSLHDSGYASPVSNDGAGPESLHAGMKGSTSKHTNGIEVLSPAKTAPSSDTNVTRALQIIAEESGMEVTDLDDDAELADCGVDSLLSLIIASRLRNELDMEIESESLFLESPTVGDLKKVLAKSGNSAALDGVVDEQVQKMTSPPPANEIHSPASENSDVHGDTNKEPRAILDIREQSVKELVHEFASGFSAPTSIDAAEDETNLKMVVLVTGGTGSLGGHLVYHLAQQPNVHRVICLNRAHREDPMKRQIQAMKDKGIRFQDSLKHKLLVLQTDSSSPRLGLTQTQYNDLAASVTHLVHQAWPMSATRPLSGFKAQFQVMRNLIDFARDAASYHSRVFKFSFEMVSSIGVVGLYDHKNTATTVVPETSASIDSVLPNGYSEAKWGCELMLDRTLHQYPDRFRTMTARLGQIAGSKTSGYWNPMEHFGFVVKSSCTLNALPDVDGKLYWTPVNDVASTLADLVIGNNDPYPIYHIDNPNGQSWREMNGYLQAALKIPNVIPFHDWLKRVRGAPQKDIPALLLSDFLESNYLRMSCGGLVLDVSHTLKHSATLRGVGPVSNQILRKYVHIWKEIGFLHATEEDKKNFENERVALWT
ncbi:ketoacyl-synt-domain-containing protein [Plenodomus tracheiphilus IPT5]|uniref:Ketoacyl-synt-domain-containing protein n=1 Tax=Plenodomus tracheiphilus IPT5 TaxID=1408161 RepID=A0A6A7API0_9PLEO|nr:ketoacyl-synt-domain-containing protein [Plenodomus tracheiphilus IPT5]